MGGSFHGLGRKNALNELFESEVKNRGLPKLWGKVRGRLSQHCGRGQRNFGYLTGGGLIARGGVEAEPRAHTLLPRALFFFSFFDLRECGV